MHLFKSSIYAHILDTLITQSLRGIRNPKTFNFTFVNVGVHIASRNFNFTVELRRKLLRRNTQISLLYHINA